MPNALRGFLSRMQRGADDVPVLRQVTPSGPGDVPCGFVYLPVRGPPPGSDSYHQVHCAVYSCHHILLCVWFVDMVSIPPPSFCPSLHLVKKQQKQKIKTKKLFLFVTLFSPSYFKL